MYLSPMQKLAADSSFLIDEIFKQQETLLDPSLADKPEVKEIIELEIRTKVCYLSNSFELYDFSASEYVNFEVFASAYKDIQETWFTLDTDTSCHRRAEISPRISRALEDTISDFEEFMKAQDGVFVPLERMLSWNFKRIIRERIFNGKKALHDLFIKEWFKSSAAIGVNPYNKNLAGDQHTDDLLYDNGGSSTLSYPPKPRYGERCMIGGEVRTFNGIGWEKSDDINSVSFLDLFAPFTNTQAEDRKKIHKKFNSLVNIPTIEAYSKTIFVLRVIIGCMNSLFFNAFANHANRFHYIKSVSLVDAPYKFKVQESLMKIHDMSIEEMRQTLEDIGINNVLLEEA